MAFSFNCTDEEKHSASHILASAAKRLFPDVKLGIGPVTKDGFYYDFFFESQISRDDLIQIENMANQIVKEDIPFKQMLLPREEAQNLLLHLGQIYKAELIKSIPDEQISFYKTGEDFIDLCRGPHVASTGKVGLIKISKIESVFWNDDKTRPSMLRIHGLVFKNVAEFNEYSQLQNELKQKNFLSTSISNGLGVKYKDNSLILSRHGTRVSSRIRELVSRSFLKFSPDQIERIQSSKKAKELSNEAIFHIGYSRKNRSYKELPLTLKLDYEEEVEINDNVYQAESIGYKSYSQKIDTLNVLISYIDVLVNLYKPFTENLAFKLYSSNLEDPRLKTISTYLQKNVISHEKILTNTIVENKMIIDCYSKDSFANEWKFADIVVENEPDSFFISRENKKQEVEIIYCKINLLKIFAFLLQEKQLSLPTEVHPVPAICIPISNISLEYAHEVKALFSQNNLELEIDTRSKSLKYKIRDALKKEIPYILVVGNKEHTNKAVSLRKNGVETGLISLEEAINMQKVAQM